MKEIAKLPSERKMWILRKFYGGQGGALPPTDPRILAMTPEQIELEFEHMLLDRAEKGEGNVYTDDGYEDYDNDTDEVDNKLSDMPTFGREASDPHAGQEYKLPKNAEISNEDEWEEVEIDRLEPSDR
jgi:hypothetical protein